MPATIGSDTRCGIGARLRSARERIGMTLLQAAEKLHVDAKVLEALEAERFDLLGATVFARGHLRRYAELVGEKGSELLDLYSEGTQLAAPDLTRLPKVGRQTDPRKLVVPGLAVLIGFALIGAVWVVLRGLHGAGSAGSVPSVAKGSAPISEDRAATAGAAAPPAISAPVMANRTTPSTPNAQPLPEHAASAASTTTPAGTARPRTVDVTLHFSSDSWVEVYDAKGERLFYDVGSADTSRSLTGEPPLRVVLGNAPGVSLEVNGRAAPVPPSAVRNDAAQFVITRSGRIGRAKPQSTGAQPGGARSRGE